MSPRGRKKSTHSRRKSVENTDVERLTTVEEILDVAVRTELVRSKITDEQCLIVYNAVEEFTSVEGRDQLSFLQQFYPHVEGKNARERQRFPEWNAFQYLLRRARNNLRGEVQRGGGPKWTSELAPDILGTVFFAVRSKRANTLTPSLFKRMLISRGVKDSTAERILKKAEDLAREHSPEEMEELAEAS